MAFAEKQHVVASGQTLWAISRRYNVSVEDIQAANGLDNSSRIKPGLKLTIPEKGDKPKPKARDTGGGSNDGPKLRTRKSTPGKKDMGGGGSSGSSSKPASAAPSSSSSDKDYAAKPKKPGFVHLKHNGASLKVTIVRNGSVRSAALPQLRELLKHRSGGESDISAELAKLIANVSDHFGGRTIHVVSGYRPKETSTYTPHSRHHEGRALDFRIEGVPPSVVADYCRTLSKAGVGYYPTSGFVHLDARDSSYHWIDDSGPGEAPRYR